MHDMLSKLQDMARHPEMFINLLFNIIYNNNPYVIVRVDAIFYLL